MSQKADGREDSTAPTGAADLDWTEAPGRLILAQIDHLSGEDLGDFIDALHAAGVKGLQVSPTVTKKNRPGQIVLIDLDPGDEPARATDVLAAYGLAGFHLIETRHFCLSHTRTTSWVTIRRGPREIRAKVGYKRLRRPGKPDLIRIEFDDLRDLSQQIGEVLRLSLAPPDLNRLLTAKLMAGYEMLIDLDR